MKMEREDYMEPACALCGKPGGEESPRPVPAGRILERLREYEDKSDWPAAERHLKYWLAEAEMNRDGKGRLMLHNELMGFYRKQGKREEAFANADAALRLVETLGMEDTGFFVPAEKHDRIATLYHIQENLKPEERDFPSFAPAFESGGGGLFSTVHDYSRFAQMLLHKGTLDGVRILGRKTIDLISTDHLTPGQRKGDSWDTQRGYGYGLGVRVMTNPEMAGSNGSVGEWGWDGAFGNWFCVDPKENLTCVYLTTNLPGDHYRFIPKLMASMYASLD